MYNKKYIKTFTEQQYLFSLRDAKNLDDIANNYINRYEKGVDAEKLAFKDSLDHYIAKKINENENYINTQEFKNYANYLRKIATQKKYSAEKGSPMYIEFSTNVVFQYLNKNMLEKIFPGNRIEKEISRNEYVINRTLQKIKNKQNLQPIELEMISDYFDNKKDLEGEDYTNYIQYILDSGKNIKVTPRIVSAILTYFPKFYREGVQDSRAYLASTDGPNQKIKIAHSSGRFPYVCFQFDKFKNVDLKSYNSAKSSRTYDYNDIMFLAFVACHELTHQKQQNDLPTGNKFDSAAMEINELIRLYDNNYYAMNHDSDEIEIEADEKSWLKCASFGDKFINEKLFSQCRKNARDVHSRRAFSVKTDEQGNRKRYMDYDVEKTKNIVKNNPGVLNRFPNLSKIFNEKGKINTDFLFENMITNTNAGREFCNYILNNVPIDLLKIKINSGNYKDEQVEKLLSNFVEVPHHNALTLRELKKTNFNTYNQTKTQLNISSNLEKVYNYYFLECCKQMEKFDKLLEIVSNQNGLNKQYIDIDSYRSFFEDYYFEMLENINIPHINSINKVLTNFKNNDSEYLNKLALKTEIRLQQKFPNQNFNNSFGSSFQNGKNRISMNNIRNAISQAQITSFDIKRQQDDIKFIMDVKSLKNKQKNGETLTKQEQILLNRYTSQINKNQDSRNQMH